MTKNSIEIAKVLVPDQSTKSLLKQALIQSADSAISGKELFLIMKG